MQYGLSFDSMYLRPYKDSVQLWQSKRVAIVIFWKPRARKGETQVIKKTKQNKHQRIHKSWRQEQRAETMGGGVDCWKIILSPFPAQQFDISIDFPCQYLCCKYLGLYQQWSWAQTKHAVWVGVSGKRKRDGEKRTREKGRETARQGSTKCLLTFIALWWKCGGCRGRGQERELSVRFLSAATKLNRSKRAT